MTQILAKRCQTLSLRILRQARVNKMYDRNRRQSDSRPVRARKKESCQSLGLSRASLSI